MLTSDYQKLKIALVGCGAVSELYYRPALQELEKSNMLRVDALYDPNYARMAQLNKYFPSAINIRDFAELLQLDIDLAIIASPPHYHSEQSIQLLNSGIAVLCEKPMAVTVAEGKDMIKAAEAAQCVLAIGLFRRFFPATQAIHELLSLNILGEVKSFYACEGDIFRWPVRSRSFFQKQASHGGVLVDIGVHLLDLLIWWWGYPVEVFYEDDAMGGIEANCRMKLTFAPGFTGEVRLSRDWSLLNRYFIQCTKGWLSWNANESDRVQMGFYKSNYTFSSQLHKKAIEKMLPAPGLPALTFEQCFVSQLCNVVEAIQGKQQLVVPGEQGLLSLKLIEYCYGNRTFMSVPWFSEQEYIRAQQLNKQSLLC